MNFIYFPSLFILIIIISNSMLLDIIESIIGIVDSIEWITQIMEE